jgi:PIN domain nuclease of toxin-antitoxin system
VISRDYIIDASAVLALLFTEPGAERVAALVDFCFMTGVTVAEIISKLRQKNVVNPGAVLGALQIEVEESFGAEAAEACGKLHAETRGMKGSPSLADCICLALAGRYGVTAVTAEKEWPAIVAGRDIKVLVIR